MSILEKNVFFFLFVENPSILYPPVPFFLKHIVSVAVIIRNPAAFSIKPSRFMVKLSAMRELTRRQHNNICVYLFWQRMAASVTPKEPDHPENRMILGSHFPWLHWMMKQSNYSQPAEWVLTVVQTGNCEAHTHARLVEGNKSCQ